MQYTRPRVYSVAYHLLTPQIDVDLILIGTSGSPMRLRAISSAFSSVMTGGGSLMS
jgi:hypothetical protein